MTRHARPAKTDASRLTAAYRVRGQLTHQPPYQVAVLPSGLTVIIASDPSARTVAARLFVGVGGANENAEQAGWSHLLEHLHISPDAVTGEAGHRLEAIHAAGATFHAQTTLQYTTYLVHVARRYWRATSRLLAAALSNPVLSPGSVASQRKVVLEEAAMRKAHSISEFAIATAVAAFAGTPYTKSVGDLAGNPESLAGATPEALAAWRDERYVASNAWLVVAGAIDYDESMEFAARIKLPVGPKPAAPVYDWAPNASAPTRLLDPTCAQSSVALDWPTFGDRDHRSAALGLASSFLDAGTGGRLFDELRTRRGLTYEPAVEHLQYSDAGSFEVWFESSTPEAADEATAAAIECVTEDWKLIDKPTLRRLQRQYIGRYELATADPTVLVSILGDTFASLGRVQQQDYVTERIKSITVEEVVELWREFLRPERVIITRQN